MNKKVRTFGLELINDPLVRSYASILSSTSVLRIAGLIAKMLLARLFAVEIFGLINFYATVITYFFLAMNLGFEIYFMKKCNEGLTLPEAVGIQFSMRSLLGSIFFTTLITYAYVFIDGADKDIFIILSLRLLLYVFDFEWLFRFRNQFNLISKFLIFQSLSVVAFAGLVVLFPNIYLLTFSYVIGEVVKTLLYVSFLRVSLSFVSLREAIKHVRHSIFVNASFFLVSIYYYLGVLAVGLFRSDFELGIYTAAYNVLLLAIVPTTLLQQVMIPKLAANLWNRRVYKEFAARTILLGSIVFLGLLLFSDVIIYVLYGERFEESARVLRMMSFDILPCYLAGAFANPINVWGEYRTYMIIVAIGAAVNIVVTLVFVPSFGYAGAVAGVIAAESSVFISGLGYYYWTNKSR
ncbi:MAG: oligosaccharide flippase family protein [Cyclobacteriaceae bacterium]